MALEFYSTSSIIPALDLIVAKHHGSILCAAFGLDFTISRILTFANRTRSDFELVLGEPLWYFDGFVHACYHDLDLLDGIPRGLPPNSIPFFAWQINRFVTYPFHSSNGRLWHVLDMSTTDPSRVIPLAPYVAFAQQRSDNRRRKVQETVDPLPLWFIREADLGLGVPIEGTLPALIHGREAFRRSDEKIRSTFMLRIHWPGYPSWTKQIRLDSREEWSNERLAGCLARKVCKFLSEHDTSRVAVQGADPRWAIATAQDGHISPRDVMLLGMIFMSSGVATPILRVCDEFVFK